MSENFFLVGWAAPPLGDDRLSITLLDESVHEAVLMGDSLGAPPVRFGVVSEVRLKKECDFPSNALVWPVMSTRMYETLHGLGELNCEATPVVLEDNGDPPLEGYLFCRLTPVDAIDWSRSEWQRTGQVIAGKERGTMRRLVLRGDAVLPPLFKLKGLASIFVSLRGRDALEQSGARGIEFHPISRAGRGMFVPVGV